MAEVTMIETVDEDRVHGFVVGVFEAIIRQHLDGHMADAMHLDIWNDADALMDFGVAFDGEALNGAEMALAHEVAETTSVYTHDQVVWMLDGARKEARRDAFREVARGLWAEAVA